jgi:DUF4097 and DUF4098 domain-containing protein YvlB
MTGSPHRRWIAIASLALVALASAGCQPVQVTSSSDSSRSNSTDGSSHVGKNSYQISQAVTEISLKGNAGDVDVVAGNGPISVTETLRYTDDKPVTSHNVNGDTLALTSADCEHERSVNGRCQVDWEIRAPAATNLTLRSESGGITVTGFSGTVSARASAGGVQGRDLTSRSVIAKSSAGGVDLAFTQPPDQVSATSSAGGVDIQLPSRTGYDVHASSATGDPDVNVQQDDNSPHKINAKTSAGTIEINNG